MCVHACARLQADSWQSFLHGKGAKKKSGFMTDLKKRESIFKTDEAGKVGAGPSTCLPASACHLILGLCCGNSV